MESVPLSFFLTAEDMSLQEPSLARGHSDGWSREANSGSFAAGPAFQVRHYAIKRSYVKESFGLYMF